MSNEYRTVYGEASLPSGLTVTLLAGHVVVLSVMSDGKASEHFGIARWMDGKFKYLQFANGYGGGGWHDGGPARADFTVEIQSALSAALCKSISQPWLVFSARLTTDGTLVRVEGLNLWTGGEFYWTLDGTSFEPEKYQSHLYDWTRCAFGPGSFDRLTDFGAVINVGEAPIALEKVHGGNALVAWDGDRLRMVSRPSTI